ncbi:MAG: hypothetical protein KIPDCIKN_02774 [Haliscomenobacter sp.]|jgi:hypothetical protein|nr:hypothetical protein [Haliscomenobacter sp.]
MALIRLFQVPKHKNYEYKPRYWDPKKEELEERIRKIRDAKEKGIEGMGERIRAGMRTSYKRDYSAMQTQVIRANIRLIAIILVLLGASYVVLIQYLPRIVNALERSQGI